jgi:hypothetical protein
VRGQPVQLVAVPDRYGPGPGTERRELARVQFTSVEALHGGQSRLRRPDGGGPQLEPAAM